MQRYDDDAVVVLFDEVGYKTLALERRARARAARAGVTHQLPLSGSRRGPGTACARAVEPASRSTLNAVPVAESTDSA